MQRILCLLLLTTLACGGAGPAAHESARRPHGPDDAARQAPAAQDAALRLQPTPSVTIAGKSGPWTSLEALDAAARFHFVVVTDRTGGHREGVFEEAMRKVNLLQPAFVFSVGDLIEGYTEDREQLDREWDEIDRMVGTLDAPFFYTPGNHDYSNETMAAVWAQRYGPDYYALTYKGALFVVLNSALFDRTGVGGHGQRRGDWGPEQARQLAWLEDTLAANADVRWTYLFMHRPYWQRPWLRQETSAETAAQGPWPRHSGQPREWKRIEGMLANRDYTAFAGHLHAYDYQQDDAGPHRHELITLATTGGVSNLRGVDYGEFDHFLWVTMTEDGPVIANLLLDGVLPRAFEQRFRRPWWAPRDPADPLREE